MAPQIYNTHIGLTGATHADVHVALKSAFAALPCCAAAVCPTAFGSRYALVVTNKRGNETSVKLHVLRNGTDADEETKWWLNFSEHRRYVHNALAHELFIQVYACIITHPAIAPFYDPHAVHPMYQPRYLSETQIRPDQCAALLFHLHRVNHAPPPLPFQRRSRTVKHITQHLYPQLFNPVDRANAVAELALVNPGVRKQAGVAQVAAAAVAAGFREGTCSLRDAYALTHLTDALWSQALLHAACTALCERCTARGFEIVSLRLSALHPAPSDTVVKCIACNEKSQQNLIRQ